MENIQEKFFSKTNISLLNSKLLENLNLKNLSENQRMFIAQTIVNNMKIIWKTLDISKIRPENFNSVLGQFNNIVHKNTFDEIKKNILSKDDNISDPNIKKFERDFKSNPNNGVVIHDRPKTILKNNNSWIGPNEQYIKNSQERHNMAKQIDQNLDNLFKPIVNELSDDSLFNNYTVGRGSDYKEKLQDIQKIRDSEVPTAKKSENDLPDFLKSTSTSVRTHDEIYENKNINNNKQFIKIQNNNLNFIDGADDDENLYSLDNIDKPLINDNYYEEDKSSFSERLNKLQNERDNIKFPKQKSVDFKSDTFDDETYDNENFNNIEPTRIDKIKNKKEFNEEYYKKNEKNEKNKNEKNKIEYIKKNKLSNEHIELFNKLKYLNKNLMIQLTTFKEENKQLKCDNLELAEKLQEIIHKEELLKEKEYELDKKYGSIINTTHLQLEINPESSISNYRYNFINTINVLGIKLTACSIPFKKYNIESDINNIFSYSINNIEKNIILLEGYYTIQEIIDNLNLNQNELNFKLNSINQKIEIISDIKFNIIPTTLSIINLGFKSNNNNNNNYIADTIHDLRIDNKVYLYFTNISDEPITIITPNTTIYDSELLFEKSVKLNYLDISFKNENNNNYNFYNINHYIHLNLIITN